MSTYFLGANSHKGFASLYRGFASAESDMLHIIKGGPGTGKSGFMRRIAAAAEARGLETDTVLCSGDPDSLDGVYIPALGEGFMDGTAPHTADPEYFAAGGDYINIGSFCRLPFSDADKALVRALNRRYKAEYSSAYDWLEAAGAVLSASAPDIMPRSGEERILSRAEELLEPLRPCGKKPCSAHRFISAISCRGYIVPALPVGSVCRIVSSAACAPSILAQIFTRCERRGLAPIACHSPLVPEKLEAVILPEYDLAFADGEVFDSGSEEINCDRELAVNALRAALPQHQKGRRLSRELTGLAIERLRNAKALHDELEEIYKAYMDFDALTEFTDRYIDNLFVNLNM